MNFSSYLSRFRLVLAACLLLAGLTAHTQFSGSPFKCKTYTTRQGLAHDFTIKCRMDSKGFLWVITQNGLSRFDGYQFRNFQHILNDSTSLPFNELSDIAIDDQDRIWLVSQKGLCFYNPRNMVFTTVARKAISICYDRNSQKIWMANTDGLQFVQLSDLTIHKIAWKTSFPNTPQYLNIDSKGRLWISISRGGYYWYDTKSGDEKNIVSEDWTRNVLEDNNNQIWICTWSNGFQKFNEAKQSAADEIYRLPRVTGSDLIYQDATQSIPLTGPDIIWVAMHTSGVALFDKKQNKFTDWIQYDPAAKSGIASDFNSSIYTDPNGIIWICSWKGLTKINKKEQQFQSAELKMLQSYDYNLLTSVIDDPYNPRFMWVGVNGGGLCYYDKTKGEPVQWFYHNEPGADNQKNYPWRWLIPGVTDLKNRIWYPTYGGLLLADRGKVTTVPVNYGSPDIYPRKTILSDDGNILICAGSGLIHFNTENRQYQYYPVNEPSVKRVYDIIRQDADHFVCATDMGLFFYNPATHVFKPIRITATNKASGEFVSFNNLIMAGRFCMAGSPSGLLQIDLSAGTSEIIGQAEEIFKLEPNTMIADQQGNCWIYTLHALYRYNPVKKEFRRFTSSDGLYDNSSDPVMMFRYKDDIYIGHRMAYTRFDPSQVDVNNNLVKPQITGISVNNQELKLATEEFSKQPLQLSYTANNFRISFAGIDYTNSEKITFAHKLEGFDRDWVQDGTNRFVSYANLKGGHYVFKLKACNSSGIWNEKETVLRIYITPPFWQRWWFWPGIAILFIAGVTWIARKRIERVKEKEKQKTAVNKMMAELETKLLRSQMNPHFIFNSLNSIQKYIWENKEEDAAEYLAKFAKLMRAILENSRMELISLKDEINTMKLYVELEHRRSNGQFDYLIQLDDNLSPETTGIPPLLMQPFIENAIWHGLNKKGSKGHLRIAVEKQGNHLICSIDDDGVGRSPQPDSGIREKKSLGIDITQQRINRLAETTGQETELTITDKKENGIPSGTLVTILIPLQKIQ